jgi:AcrR family transcriptional regulator
LPGPHSTEAALKALADAYLQFCQSNPSYFRLIMAFDRGRFEESISSELYQQVLDRSLRGLDLLAQTLENGNQKGDLCVQDPWQAAGSVWAALNGVLVLMAHPLRQRILRTNLTTMFQDTLGLVLDGLAASRPTDGCP